MVQIITAKCARSLSRYSATLALFYEAYFGKECKKADGKLHKHLNVSALKGEKYGKFSHVHANWGSAKGHAYLTISPSKEQRL